jgi:hypothetical protein
LTIEDAAYTHRRSALLDFLAHTNVSARSIAVRVEQQTAKTNRELRRMIPAEALIRMQIEAAVTGFLPTYDRDGNECGPAAPIKTETRLELMKELRRIRLPDAKVEEDNGRDFDPTTLPTTLRDAESMTPKELDEAIAASYTLHQETEKCPPTPTTASSPSNPKGTDGSSSPSTPDLTPRP